MLKITRRNAPFVAMFLNAMDYWLAAAFMTSGFMVLLSTFCSLGVAITIGLSTLLAVWVGVSLYQALTLKL